MVPARVGPRGVGAMEQGAHREEHADNYGRALIGRAPDGVRNVSGLVPLGLAWNRLSAPRVPDLDMPPSRLSYRGGDGVQARRRPWCGWRWSCYSVADRKSTRLNSSHIEPYRMPSS